MKDQSFADAYNNELLKSWSDITLIGKPIIAAVNGFAVSTYFSSRSFFISNPASLEVAAS